MDDNLFAYNRFFSSLRCSGPTADGAFLCFQSRDDRKFFVYRDVAMDYCRLNHELARQAGLLIPDRNPIPDTLEYGWKNAVLRMLSRVDGTKWAPNPDWLTEPD